MSARTASSSRCLSAAASLLLLLVVALSAAPRVASAQDPCPPEAVECETDENPPVIAVLAPLDGFRPRSVAAVPFSIVWCDQLSLDDAVSIRWNNVERSGSFDYMRPSDTHLQGCLANDAHSRLRTVAPLDSGGSFNAHVYAVCYGYDIMRRRSWMKYPSNLMPADRDSLAYSYDATGRLDTVRSPFLTSFRHAWNKDGQLDTLYFPDAVLQARTYDLDGRMLTRREWRTVSGTTKHIHADTLAYDTRGKILRADTRTGPTVNAYSALGAVWRSASATPSHLMDRDEHFVVDALGNQRFRSIYANPMDATNFLYEPGTSRIHASRSADGVIAGMHGAQDTLVYDAFGNRIRELKKTYHDDQYAYEIDETRWYYSDDGKLRVSDYRSCLNDGDHCLFHTEDWVPAKYKSAYEEYRYDALGRRVWVRRRSDGLSRRRSRRCSSASSRSSPRESPRRSVSCSPGSASAYPTAGSPSGSA